MRRAERVVLALAALGEAAEAAALAQGADPAAPRGQDLVRISLMADIPDQLVIGRVEDIVDRDSQFDHAETRAEVPAGCADGADHLAAQLVGKLAQLARREPAQVGGNIDSVEKRRCRV